jgi:endonuclease III
MIPKAGSDRAGGMENAVEKRPFDIDNVMKHIRDAVQPYPKAALFELAEDGFSSPFEQLLACIISIRTRDEATVKIARNLFARARTPEEICSLTLAEIEQTIYGTTFRERKAAQIHQIAQRLMADFQGEMPCDETLILSFPGVGIKCANLTLGIACAQQKISVDIHVHRVTNRWGYVLTSSPEQTTDALIGVLPRRFWLEINALLVPFGKHICTGVLPRCSTCPVFDMCRQVGVKKHR